MQLYFNRADPGRAPRSERAAGAYDAYIHVTGIDALAAELSARRADILDGPTDRVYGQRELVIRDVNGLILAFGETVNPSPSAPA